MKNLADEKQAGDDDIRHEMIHHMPQGTSYETLGDVLNLFTDPDLRTLQSVVNSPGAPLCLRR